MKLNKFPKELESHFSFNQPRFGVFLQFTTAKEMFDYSDRSFNKHKLSITDVYEYEKERLHCLMHDKSIVSEYSLYYDCSPHLCWLNKNDVDLLCRRLALFLKEKGYKVTFSRKTNVLHISWDAYEIE